MITPDLLKIVYFYRKLSPIFVSGDFKDTLELEYWRDRGTEALLRSLLMGIHFPTPGKLRLA